MRKIRLLIAVYKDPDWELRLHKRLFVSGERELQNKLTQALSIRSSEFEINKLASRIWEQGYASTQYGTLAVYAHRLAPEYLPVSMTAASLPEPRRAFFSTFQIPRFKLPQIAIASALMFAVVLVSLVQPAAQDENRLALAACPGAQPDYVAYVSNSMTAEEWSEAKSNNWADKEKFGRTHFRNHGAREGRQMWCMQDV